MRAPRCSPLWLLILPLATALSSACSGSGTPAAGGGTTGDASGGNESSGAASATGGSSSATGGSAQAGAGGGGTSGDGTGGRPIGGGANGGSTGGDGGELTLSDRYPGDAGLADDEAVLFFDDFEGGWGRWSAPDADTPTLTLRADAGLAHAGTGVLQSSVTSADLEADEYISSQAHIEFARQTEALYVRFYAQFVGTAPTPHHWVRVTAGTPEYGGSGLANTVPPGDGGFWFDFDASTDDVFNFYVYWYLMRSGRCNDGSTTEGCAGDQGVTYHYGNFFQPPEQDSFGRDTWLCIELYAKANSPSQSDGELAFWVNDQLIGDYRPGFPDGTWLRDSFHTGGCDFSACTDPVPFEGFDFRSSANVLFKGFVLDAYYERGSSQDRRQQLESQGIVVDDAQTILYDDVVVATERIGCRQD